MTRILSLFVVFMLTGALAFAQTRVVTGKVVDQTGQDVPFATITVAGTKTSEAADRNGSFSIKVGPNQSLVVSAAGFTTGTFPVVGNRADILLQKTNAALQEVVVTGSLGGARTKKSTGYASAKIASTELIQAAPVNLINGLQGKVSGLNITSVNSGVFEDVKINLRGIRSLTGNNSPMLLLDGIPTSLNFLSSINPQDIQDVNVLKGASAAGIYGSDAINGVIVVTTKRGGNKGNPTITLSRTTQFSSISFFPKFQTQFGSGGSGDYIPFENWSWGPAYDGSIKPLGSDLKDGTQQLLPYSPNNSRQEFFNTGVTNQTDLSFAVKEFYLSLQDAKITGIVPNDKNRRTSIRLNTDKTYGAFKVGLNVNYIQQNFNVFDDNAMANYNAANGVGLNNGLLNLIFNTPAQVPLTNYKNYKNEPFGGYNTYFNHYGLNPYLALDNWRRFGKVDDVITNLDLNYKVNNNLNLTARFAGGFKNTNVSNTSQGQKVTPDNVNTNTLIPASINESFARSSRMSSEFFATYNKSVKDFKFTVIAGHYLRETQTKNNSVGATNLVVPEIYNINNGVGGTSGSNSMSKIRTAAVFGSANINYKGWANVELIGRNEWTSLLSQVNNNNVYFYPTVNAALVLSEAIPALKGNNTLSNLKIRGSWARTGNVNVGAYQLASTFGGTASGFPYTVPGYTANNTAFDPLLKPEFVTGTDFGVEFGLFKNRVSVELSAYQQKSTDQVINVSVSPATGFTTANVNAASFDNKGYELDLNFTPLVNLGGVDIRLKANASYNTNKIKSIFPGLERLGLGGFATAGNFGLVGKPAFVFLASDYKRDAAGRVEVNSTTGVPIVDPTLKEFGRTLPLWIVGLTPSVSYKNLTLSVVGEYRGGHFAYANIGNSMAWTGVSAATAQNSRERYVFPNSYYLDGTGKAITNTNVQVNDINNFYTVEYRNAQSNFIVSAASWRVREVSLNYDFPTAVFADQKFFKGASVSLSARNLFLWLPKSNNFTDPDFNTQNLNGGNISGISDSQVNPPTRIIGLNITAKF